MSSLFLRMSSLFVRMSSLFLRMSSLFLRMSLLFCRTAAARTASRAWLSRSTCSIFSSSAARVASTASIVARFCERMSSRMIPWPRISARTSFSAVARRPFSLGILALQFTSPHVARVPERRAGDVRSRGGTAVVAATAAVSVWRMSSRVQTCWLMGHRATDQSSSSGSTKRSEGIKSRARTKPMRCRLASVRRTHAMLSIS